ncbi:maltokinase N-terminal cap-like domain-containing protein [Aeromicrobium sp. CF3.5]|uniref:maltokinase N-terminal cap-like domain-containing protein n=1 Tax=Aeromicrobium sp. CF3.5 TaxID=3373078 RepID=UPI003EE6ED90
MALLHPDATISPTKAEVVALWLRSQPWLASDATDLGLADLEMIGSYRFDDPAGEVGLEVLLARLGDGRVVQVPLTYRGSALDGGEDFGVCTMSHSVLGDRWIYAGAGDPVFVTALVTTICTGATESPMQFEDDGLLRTREPVVTVRGSGATGAVDVAEWIGAAWIGAETGRQHTVVHTSAGDLSIPHVLDPGADTDGLVLTGRYPGVDVDVVLARLVPARLG